MAQHHTKNGTVCKGDHCQFPTRPWDCPEPCRRFWVLPARAQASRAPPPLRGTRTNGQGKKPNYQSCLCAAGHGSAGCGARSATARLIRLETWSMNTRHARAYRFRVDAGWATLRPSSALATPPGLHPSLRKSERRPGGQGSGGGIHQGQCICEGRDSTIRSCSMSPGQAKNSGRCSGRSYLACPLSAVDKTMN